MSSEYTPTSESSTNKLISDYYIFIKKIGSGSFGEVYLTEHKGGGYAAAKVEDRNRLPRIINEYKIYKYLYKHNFTIGLPKIYDFYQTPDFNIMVMQLLGPSLEDLFAKYDKKFNLSTVLLLALQLVDLLEQLHNADFLHRDIKPNNFLIGRGKNKDKLFMMDFGLSKKFIKNNKHIKFRHGRSLIGTARYASLNMHFGLEPSRRDDLESVGYMLIYFIKGSLPWQGLKRDPNIDHIQVIGEKKLSTSISVLCSGIHECFQKYIEYCRRLQFDETPDYRYMKSLFNTAIIECGPCNYKWIH